MKRLRYENLLKLNYIFGQIQETLLNLNQDIERNKDDIENAFTSNETKIFFLNNVNMLREIIQIHRQSIIASIIDECGENTITIPEIKPQKFSKELVAKFIREKYIEIIKKWIV